MVQKDSEQDNCRLRIDPVLVDKFRRLPGGINEVGTKIVRDLGLRYQYDKNRGTLEIIGPDTEILALAVESLRFWVEDDDFPDTGITCQVGYPNRRIVIWRFHGDYAKKFDHLFADDIAKLKLKTSVNIKAVPNKRNPEYIELYCHFSVYHQVKPEVIRISKELGRIFQDDFFIPKSDFTKARNFARSKISDDKVLYALKEYPDNKVRVWLFARDQLDVIRAKREWVLHVGINARNIEFTEAVRRDNSIKSASFFGHPASELGSDISGPIKFNEKHKDYKKQNQQPENKAKHITQTSLNLSQSRSKLKSQSQTNSSTKDISPRGPRIDNPNFPRPPDFVYPVQKEPLTQDVDEKDAYREGPTNPFAANAEILEDLAEENVQHSTNLLIGEAKWVPEEETNLYRARQLSRPFPNRIYVHHQINDKQLQNQPENTTADAFTELKTRKQVAHPEKNLVEKERFNPTHHSKSVLTSVTDPRQAPAIKRGNKAIRPGEKTTKQGKVNATTRQKRPVLKVQKQPTIRYNINVNGLDIYMYKQDITKLNNMDALVNVVAPNLKDGDLIAKSLFAEAGKTVRDEVDVHLSLYGEAKMAENVVTSAGSLPALGFIHVVSPIWQRYTVWQDCASDLHKALYDVLKTAETHKYRKIGIPTIGSEPFFGIPKDLVAEVYVKALIDYSMGMGPMYPVLEIHLVDTDHNMLKYIKDAYESWASTPGVADMTQHITKEGEQIMKNPDEVSTRSQSAVNLKSVPSHRSENMVTFTGQSYTKEGEQKWTFDVLKKLVVHVYTGSVLKLDDVEAIVCAVEVDMKGTLAKQIQSLGGKSYRTSLKSARGNRTLDEGEVLVCDAGELGMRKVLHSVISTPIRQINQKNLSRLDSINTQVFYAANQNGIKVLAMPLIGTSRLRERFEVEQCSLQLIDNIIEMCLSLGQGMKIKELHLVNTNHVMTQYLTQALRIRAHTKLRMETEPHVPSRQEVLTTAEAIHRTPEKIDKMSVISGRSKASSSQSANKKRSKDNNEKQNNGKNSSSNDKPAQGENKLENNKDTAKSILRQTDNKLESINSDKRKLQPKETHNNKNGNTKRFAKDSNYKKHIPYLSQKNLETHDRLIRDAWAHLMDDEMEGIENNVSKRPKKLDEQKRHQELEPLDKDVLLKKASIFLKERKSEKAKTTRKRKHRVIQRSSDFIFQRSKAESYKSLHERKQKFAEQAKTQEQIKLRKTQSSDDIWRKQIADKVFETFKEEREKLSRQKKLALESKMTLTENDQLESDQHLKETKKYFTRDTKDRHKPNVGTSKDDISDKFERFNRINVNEGDTETGDILYEIHSKTERSENQSNIPRLRKARSERRMIDTEREDMYMMDMDFFAKEREEFERKKKEKVVETDTDVEGLHDKSFTKSERSRKMRKDRLIALTSSEKKIEEWEQYLDTESPQKRHSTPDVKYLVQETEITKGIDDSAIVSGDDTSLEKDLASNSLEQTSGDLYTSRDVKPVIHRTKGIEDDLDLGVYAKQPNSQALKSGKSFKTYAVNASTVENSPTEFKDAEDDKQSRGRVRFVQTYSNKPRADYENQKLTKTVDWKNGRKMTKEALQLFNEQRKNALRAPKPDKVTIKEKLKLQINVIDKAVENGEQIEKEKKKIRRFWEAVDGKELRDEKEMFGEPDNKDKVLVAKVTKERIMSAKTRDSKKSKGSVLTHNVGDFNVTLEVGN